MVQFQIVFDFGLNGVDFLVGKIAFHRLVVNPVALGPFSTFGMGKVVYERNALHQVATMASNNFHDIVLVERRV